MIKKGIMQQDIIKSGYYNFSKGQKVYYSYSNAQTYTLWGPSLYKELTLYQYHPSHNPINIKIIVPVLDKSKVEEIVK